VQGGIHKKEKKDYEKPADIFCYHVDYTCDLCVLGFVIIMEIFYKFVSYAKPYKKQFFYFRI